MTMVEGSIARRCGQGGLPVVLGGAALVLMATAAGAAPAKVWSDVRHNTTLVQYFDDDPCGRGQVIETMANRLEFQRLTQLDDGSFHFVDFETGLIYEDWVDPNIQDNVYRRTNTFSLNLTRGGVFTRSETFRQSDGAISFIYRYHLTEVRGTPVVEKEVDIFPYPSECPGQA